MTKSRFSYFHRDFNPPKYLAIGINSPVLTSMSLIDLFSFYMGFNFLKYLVICINSPVMISVTLFNLFSFHMGLVTFSFYKAYSFN